MAAARTGARFPIIKASCIGGRWKWLTRIRRVTSRMRFGWIGKSGFAIRAIPLNERIRLDLRADSTYSLPGTVSSLNKDLRWPRKKSVSWWSMIRR